MNPKDKEVLYHNIRYIKDHIHLEDIRGHLKALLPSDEIGQLRYIKANHDKCSYMIQSLCAQNEHTMSTFLNILDAAGYVEVATHLRRQRGHQRGSMEEEEEAIALKEAFVKLQIEHKKVLKENEEKTVKFDRILQDKMDQIDRLEAGQSELQTQVMSLQKQVEEKDMQIDTLEDKLETMISDHREVQERNANELKDLTDENRALHSNLRELRKELHERRQPPQRDEWRIPSSSTVKRDQRTKPLEKRNPKPENR